MGLRPMLDHHPLLRKLDAFSPLSDGDRRFLAQLVAHPVAVPARTDMIRDGERPHGAFMSSKASPAGTKSCPTGAGRCSHSSFLATSPILTSTWSA